MVAFLYLAYVGAWLLMLAKPLPRTDIANLFEMETCVSVPVFKRGGVFWADVQGTGVPTVTAEG